MWPARAAAIPVSTGAFWLLTGLNAVEEILDVGDGAVLETVCPDDRVGFGRNAFAIDAKAAAVELQGCVTAAEFEAAVQRWA
jgi:hypothetical protein